MFRTFPRTLLTVLLFATSVAAQEIRIVIPPERLPIPYASSAKLSPTGEYISFTGKAFEKLYVADSDGENAHELCSHAAVGWGHQWSPDGKYIVVRANHQQQNTKRVAIELLDVANHAEIAVTGPLSSRSRLSLPQWNRNDLLTFTTRSGLELKRVELTDSTVSVVSVPRQEVSFSRWSTDALEQYDGGKSQRIRPFRQARQVLNSSWSPNNNLSVVEFAGRPSLYVVSRDGKNPVLIDAKGESPCWLNENYIVYMVTEDDGHRILSGNIWITDNEGKVKKNLTEGFGEVALYPSAANDGTIVFTTERGAVYKMKIAVH